MISGKMTSVVRAMQGKGTAPTSPGDKVALVLLVELERKISHVLR